MEAPKRIWRDDLALAMLAGWVNAPVDKMPPEMRAHTCEATAIAWGMVANAAREHLASEHDRLMAEANAEIARLREALIDATAHLAGAASAYEKYAGRSKAVGRGRPDPFFKTRLADFNKAVERARAALGDNKPINWAKDPDAVVEDDEPQIGRDYA